MHLRRAQEVHSFFCGNGQCLGFEFGENRNQRTDVKSHSSVMTQPWADPGAWCRVDVPLGALCSEEVEISGAQGPCTSRC